LIGLLSRIFFYILFLTPVKFKHSAKRKFEDHIWYEIYHSFALACRINQSPEREGRHASTKTNNIPQTAGKPTPLCNNVLCACGGIRPNQYLSSI